MPSQRNNSSVQPQLISPAVWRTLVAAGISIGTLVYFLNFLAMPLLAGLNDLDGRPVTRIQFLFGLLQQGNPIGAWLHELQGYGKLPVNVVDRIPILLGAVLTLAVAWGLGEPVVRSTFSEKSHTRLEAHALAVLAGVPILSLLMLVFGVIGAANLRSGPAAIGALAIGLQVYRRLNSKQRSDTSGGGSWTPTGPWLPETNVSSESGMNRLTQLTARFVVALVVAVGGLYCLGVLMPPYEFDVVEYHLQAPKEFYQRGWIGFCETNVYNNMPMGMEMLSLFAMSAVGGTEGWWWGGLVGKASIGLLSLVAAALLGGYFSRVASRWIGWATAGLWLSVPGNAINAWSGLIDSALAAYLLATCLVLMRHLSFCNCIRSTASGKSETVDHDNHRLIFLLFLFAGFAAAIKYPGLVYVVLPTLIGAKLHAWMGWRSKQITLTQLWNWGVAGALGLCMTCVPWYAKNLVTTGNPFYPLAYSVFGGRGIDAQHAEQWNRAHRPQPVDGGESAFGLGAFRAGVSKVTLASDAVLPGLIALACVGAVISFVSRTRERILVIGIVWIFGVWWLATHRIDRFWLPATMIQSLLAGGALHWIARQRLMAVAAPIVVVSIMYGAVVSSSSIACDNRFLVSLDALRHDAGGPDMVGRISPAIVWCNRHLDPTSHRILLVGEARAFDFKAPVVYSTCFNKSPAEQWLRDQSPEVQIENLAEAGVTHVLVNWAEVQRYRQPGNYGFSDWPQPGDLDKLIADNVLKPVDWQSGGHSEQLLEFTGRK